MTYALIVVQNQLPNQTITADIQWKKFASTTDNILSNSKTSESLADNVWLLDLHNELHIFSQLICQAEDYGFPCRTIFFDQKPVFCLS